MKKWLFWGAVAAVAYKLLKDEEKTSPTRVSWVSPTGPQSRDFQMRSVAETFRDALIGAGATNVQLSAIA
jgi:hypothetical protein